MRQWDFEEDSDICLMVLLDIPKGQQPVQAHGHGI